jgi:hypothetical protein
MDMLFAVAVVLLDVTGPTVTVVAARATWVGIPMALNSMLKMTKKEKMRKAGFLFMLPSVQHNMDGIRTMPG